MKTLAGTLRWLLAPVFIFSGIVKLIDPVGTAIRIQDYALALLGSIPDADIATFLSVVLSATECVLGIFLLQGIWRRTTTLLILALLLFYTPLTWWLAHTDAVADCGCFGDFIHLTNWQTFWKNAVLLAMAIPTAIGAQHIRRIIPRRSITRVSLFNILYATTVALASLYEEPIIDFRPYHIGQDIIAAAEWGDDPDEVPDIVDLDLDVLPPTIHNDTCFTMLLLVPRLQTAQRDETQAINRLADLAQQHDIPFLCLTTSDTEAQHQWTLHTGALYPFAFMDQTTLQTMARSNPALLLLHGSTIVGKWGHHRIPDTEDVEDLIRQGQYAPSFLQNPHTRVERATFWLLVCYLIPFFAIAGLKRKPTTQTIKPNTMRKKIVAGNWKMNLSLQEGVALATELKGALAAAQPNCDVIICTPFIHLASVAQVVEGTAIGLGAENCADKEKGAYTGEVSAAQVKSTGAQYVILGHSERRAYYHETAQILKEKVNLALANGLKVIFCIGEVLEEREAGKQNQVVEAQLADSLFDLTAEQLSNIILAYEPVWAIGTGKTATAEQAEDMHAFIREVIARQFGQEAAQEISILYGGSCKPSNAREIFSKPDVDGGLIGGAALKCADFKGIIDAWD